MNIVHCIDRKVLPGLHVAAFSLLDHIGGGCEIHFSVFSDTVTGRDMDLLRETLLAARKPFKLELCQPDFESLTGFPPLNGSPAAYYRLLVAQAVDVERFLYVDADTLCDIDVSELRSIDLGDSAVGWVPEASMANAIDRAVAAELGNSTTEPYSNSGVMLVDVAQWRRQRVTERAMEYIVQRRPAFHDQSALNVVLHRNAVALDERYNCLSNVRKNWPFLRQSYGRIGRLVHFIDYPKPWDLLGELVHPQYRIWRSVLDRTAMSEYRSWRKTPARRIPKTRKEWVGYKKAVKDRLLFDGYSSGLLRQVKGVSQP